MDFISNLIEIIDIIGIDRNIIIKSLVSQISDFEDAIQSISSLLNNIDYIITRNQKVFSKSDIKALTPVEFVNLIIKKESK